MKVILEVDKGANAGTSYEVELRSYRALGRARGAEQTIQLSEDEPALEPDDLAKIEAHVGKRHAPDDGGDHVRIGAFRRGRDVRLDDPGISRTHAVVFLDDLGPSIVDLDSANGTRLNGDRIRDADLRDGDILNLGKTRIVVRWSRGG